LLAGEVVERFRIVMQDPARGLQRLLFIERSEFD